MNLQKLVTPPIDAIFFDMNGTLRRRFPDEAWQRRSWERMLSLLGMPGASRSFFDELSTRYKAYTSWADEHETSLPEAQVWSGWLVPELPRDRIEPQAAELMLAFRNCRGRNLPKAETVPVLAELQRRGYRLGVISNTTSTIDLPRFIRDFELEKYFEAVVLSAACGVRKPNPRIFLEAARRLQLDPARCAYVGNKPAQDIAGPRRAGFGMAILVRPDARDGERVALNEQQPDQNTHQLSELLHIFPPRTEGLV